MTLLCFVYREGGAPKRLSYFEARWDYVGSTDANPCVLIIRLCIFEIIADHGGAHHGGAHLPAGAHHGGAC